MPDPIESSPETPEVSGSVVQQDLEFALITPNGTPQAAFRLTSTGIVIREDLNEEEWRDGLRLFKWAQTSLKLGFANYLAFGELHFGKEKVDRYLGQLEFDLPTVTQAISINSIPEDIKHANLTAEHYIVLARASLKKPGMTRWARTASEQNLTPPQLKASIEAGEVVSTTLARKNTHGIISVHGLRAEFDIWLRRVGDATGIMKQDRENILEIINEIEPIAELHAKLELGLQEKKRQAKEPQHATA